MTTFNKNFYKSEMSYTREFAESRLVSLGYKNFTFKKSCYSNGASFYFESEYGQEIRVSDHILTGERAFNTIQVSIVEIKTLENPKTLRAKYLSGEISKKEYKSICKEKGFIFKA